MLEKKRSWSYGIRAEAAGKLPICSTSRVSNFTLRFTKPRLFRNCWREILLQLRGWPQMTCCGQCIRILPGVKVLSFGCFPLSASARVLRHRGRG